MAYDHLPPPTPTRVPGWAKIAMIVQAVVIVVLLASLGQGAPETSRAYTNPPRTSYTTPYYAPAPYYATTTPYTPPAPSPNGPLSDGTYFVGTDITAGTWNTTGGGRCYYSRLRNTDGDVGSIIDNGNFTGPTTIRVGASDAAVEFSGPCVWTRRG